MHILIETSNIHYGCILLFALQSCLNQEYVMGQLFGVFICLLCNVLYLQHCVVLLHMSSPTPVSWGNDDMMMQIDARILWVLMYHICIQEFTSIEHTFP